MGRLLSRNEKFVRLFTIFETELVNYSGVFRNSNYSIDYIIQINKFSDDYNIQVIFSVLRIPVFNSEETRPIKQIIENFASIFSINDIRVIRPLNRLNQRINAIRQIKPIEERIYLEFKENGI